MEVINPNNGLQYPAPLILPTDFRGFEAGELIIFMEGAWEDGQVS